MNRSLYFVVDADRRGLSYIGMTINRFFDFTSPDAVSRDVNHIVGSTQNIIIARLRLVRRSRKSSIDAGRGSAESNGFANS